MAYTLYNKIVSLSLLDCRWMANTSNGRKS